MSDFPATVDTVELDLAQLDFVEPLLRRIVLETQAAYGVRFIVTSIYRPGDKGVHGTLPVRGVDVRMRDLEVGELIEEQVNRKWQYDPRRPSLEVCEGHGEGANYHLHFQVHPNTRRK